MKYSKWIRGYDECDGGEREGAFDWMKSRKPDGTHLAGPTTAIDEKYKKNSPATCVCVRARVAH